METTFFILSKLIGVLIRPDTWVVLMVALVVLALIRGRVRSARMLSLVLLAALVLVAILPFGDFALRSLESRYPVNPAVAQLDGIIVLGGAEDASSTAHWDQVQLNSGAERYTVALALAKKYPNARILFSGGSGALRDLEGNGLSEADVAARFFIEQGLSEGRLIFEGSSRNTSDNARLSIDLVRPAKEETWVLITSAYHMPRAMRSFTRAGWTALVPYPVDFRSTSVMRGVGWNLTGNLQGLNIVAKEWVGNLVYRLLGK